MSHESSRLLRPFRPLRHWQFWSVCTIVALTGSAIACDRHMNADPTFALPASTPLPVPNAYDDFRQAVALHRERDYDKRTGKPKPLSLAQVNTLFADNAAAIRALHKGFAHQYQMPPKRPADFAESRENTVDAFRSLARTLAFETEQRAARGDVDGALDGGLDGAEMGAMLPHGGGATDWMVGNACEAIAGKKIWLLAPRLNADQASRAVRRLESIEAQRGTFADALREEEWRGISWRCGDMHNTNREKIRLFNAVGEVVSATTPTESKEPGAIDETPSPVGVRQKWAAGARILTLSKQQVVDNYADWMQAQIAGANIPYNAPPPPLPVMDPFNRIMEVGYRQTRFHGTYHQTEESLLTATLALRAYRLRTGAYPPSLASLIPAGILRHVPTDPFAPVAGTPLHYRPLAKDTYLLYSVGPDGIDDDGRPVDFTKSLPDGMVFKNRAIISTDVGDMRAR